MLKNSALIITVQFVLGEAFGQEDCVQKLRGGLSGHLCAVGLTFRLPLGSEADLPPIVASWGPLQGSCPSAGLSPPDQP